MYIEEIEYRKAEHLEVADAIDYAELHSEMTSEERYFVNGIIREIKPKSLLEVGVSAGGGSVNILNAIQDDAEAFLVSIDSECQYYRDSELPVGVDAIQRFGSDHQWKLITGKDSSEVLSSMNRRFDFAIIDTAHVHPVETLNFLCVLPYLSDGAIVVFHDISLMYYKAGGKYLATRILMSCLNGKKIFPTIKSSNYISDTELIHNICAVQITQDLRQNIYNLFYSLAIPWEYYPGVHIESIRKELKRHYTAEEVALFNDAERRNFAYLLSGGQTHSLELLISNVKCFMLRYSRVVFYGAGIKTQLLIRLFQRADITFDYPVWDINAKMVQMIEGHEVSYPEFVRPQTRTMVVVMLRNAETSAEVIKKLKFFGYDSVDADTFLSTPPLNSSQGKPTQTTQPIHNQFPCEFNEDECKIAEYILKKNLSMVSPQRLFSTMKACRYVVENKIPGDFAECGVWRGGNALAAAMVFKMLGSDKKVWLFDTFHGFDGLSFDDADKRTDHYDEVVKDAAERYYDIETCGNSLESVKANFEELGLLGDNIMFVQGDVGKTLREKNVPDCLSVLRLDTDWYASTLLELEVLYPKVSRMGVLLIDDYGHCPGCQRAVDEYFAARSVSPFFHYDDYTGRCAVKTDES